MPHSTTGSTVLTLRVPRALEQRLAREARRRRTTRSEVARAILEERLAGAGPDLADEARRQSQLVARRRSERATLDFIRHAADTDGWRD